MTCRELFEELKTMAAHPVDAQHTCDTFKGGDPDAPIAGVAVSMFATPDVVRKAAERGANLLIVHEPVYYNHMDNGKNDTFPADAKEELIANSGLTIFRFHDYAHACEPDLICEGELKYLGLPGTFVKGKYFAANNFILDKEMTALELARVIENRLGVRHVRIAGDKNASGKKISCSFGTPGHLEESLAENDFVLTGEICEWGFGETVRDYAQLGQPKAVLVLGHIGSERAGMMLLAEKISARHPGFECFYIECGEVYSYTDE